MDGLSAAASVIAVIQITGQIVGLCQTYYTAVKNSRQEIKRLQNEVIALDGILSRLADLDDGPDQRKLATLQGLEKHLCDCYECLRTLLTGLQSHDGMSKFGLRSLKWPLKRKDVDDAVDTIERFKATFTLALSVDLMTKVQLTENKLTALNEQAEIDRAQNIAERGTEIRDKLYSWLAAPDPFMNFDNALQRRELTTGNWFLNGEKFRTWTQQNNSLLWLHGKPGSGKTILSASTINGLQDRTQQDSGVAVIYYYFDFNDKAKQNAEGCVRALIKQLSVQSAAAFTAVELFWEKHQSNGHQPSLEALQDLLRLIISLFDQTYIVLNALDECFEREGLMELLNSMHTWFYAHMHLMVTSRNERDLEECLLQLRITPICLSDEGENMDINIYIDKRLDEDSKLNRWPQKARDDIRTALMDKADGMFRWVACQVEALRKCLNIKALQKTLDSLPKTLDETYERILKAIDDDYRDDALNALTWLCFSSRPLQMDEINDAIAISKIDGNPIFDTNKRLRDARDILLICPSLLIISDSNTVSLAHFSVKEYLESQRIKDSRVAGFAMQPIRANHSIVIASLYYLSHAFLCSPWTFGCVDKEYPLAIYAARRWTHHVRECGSEEITSQVLERILNFLRDGFAVKKWRELWDPDWPDAVPAIQSVLIKVQASMPLYHTSLEGLVPVVDRLLREEVLTSNAGRFGSPLQASLHNGYTQIAKMLIARGADIHQCNGYYGHSLVAAAVRGNLEMINELIRLGVSVNENFDPDRRVGSWVDPVPLHRAAENSHLEVVRALLFNGADINQKSNSYRTALGRACAEGHEHIVKYLLAKGATANDGDALSSAAWGNKHKIMNILIAAGAEVDGGGTALEGAACNGTVETVKLLLENGANLHSRGLQFGRALIAALKYQKFDIVQVLLDYGVDPNITNPLSSNIFQAAFYGESALQIACQDGLLHIVQYLLEHAADPNLPGPVKGNPLCVAAHSVSLQALEIIRLLLRDGADPNAKDKAFGTSLRAAAVTPYLESGEKIKLLLDAGADIDMETRCFPTALHRAVLANNFEAVSVLIERGANINTNHPKDGSPLQKAIEGGFEKIESLLREHGASL